MIGREKPAQTLRVVEMQRYIYRFTTVNAYIWWWFVTERFHTLSVLVRAKRTPPEKVLSSASDS